MASGRRKRSGSKSVETDGPKFHVPKDEEVAVAVLRAMQERGPFWSQREFRDAVIGAMRAKDPKATVGAERLRRIALRSGSVHLELAYRDGGDGTGDGCPVCGSALRRVRNRTLNRRTVVVGFDCPQCVYRTGNDRLRPARYQFSSRRM